ncbi:MAG: rod shape-determining protein MreC [Bacillota bacterium]
MRRQLPFRKTITLVILVAASVSVLNITGKTADGDSWWTSTFFRLVKPLYEGLARVRVKYDTWIAMTASKEILMEENRRLSRQMETLEYLRALVADLRQENARLRDLLDFAQNAPAEYMVAEIVGRNPTKWFSTIVISLGQEDGVKADSPVVSSGGLVGRVLSVDRQLSTVLLITDAESGVGAITESTRDCGVVMGTGDPQSLIMQFFSKDAQVSPGDRVLTSGLGSKFPAGILIGEVVSVYVPKPGLIKEALVKPVSDMEHLEEVMVMKW